MSVEPQTDIVRILTARNGKRHDAWAGMDETPKPDPMTPEGQQAIVDRLTRGDADDTAEAL